MFENSEAFDLFISELLDEKIKNLSATNGEYAAIKTKSAHEADSLETYFSHNDIKIIEDFHDLICDLSAIENRYLYFQGFKDCIRLLKRLEVY